MDFRLFASNVLPETLRRIEDEVSSLASLDLVALSGGHDFLLQVSNAMCSETVFGSLQIPWIAGGLDPGAVAALRGSGASFTSPVLQQVVASPVDASAGMDVLLLLNPHDVLFDSPDHCRARFGVRVALGSLLVVPKEPGLTHSPSRGETVESIETVVGRVGQALLAAGGVLAGPLGGARANGPQLLSTRDQMGLSPSSVESPVVFAHDSLDGIAFDTERHIDLGDRSSFEVSAWLGGGLLEIGAPFAAVADQPSATIRVTADVSQATAIFTGLSHDAALILSDADPLGLVQTTTHRVRALGRLALVDDISLVGGPATATVGDLEALEPDAFACGQGAYALNVGATIIPGAVAARNTVAFIGTARYGVVWSAAAVRLLVRFCWETGAFPRGIGQVSGVHLKVDGVDQTADAISTFHLDTLDVIELEYDANGRTDVLYTRGMARVIPQIIRLADGRELVAQDPHDPVFAPSDPLPWAALGELTEQSLVASSADLLQFERAVTSGVTSRLGRPFAEPATDAVVTDSRISAPAQRVALLTA